MRKQLQQQAAGLGAAPAAGGANLAGRFDQAAAGISQKQALNQLPAPPPCPMCMTNHAQLLQHQQEQDLKLVQPQVPLGSRVCRAAAAMASKQASRSGRWPGHSKWVRSPTCLSAACERGHDCQQTHTCLFQCLT